MFKYQRITQLVIIGLYVLAVLANLVENGFGRILNAMVLLGMIALVPIGITQLFGSIIHNMEYKSKSKLKLHLKVSGITILVLLTGVFFMSTKAYRIGEVLFGSAMIVSLILMIFYWVIIFQKQVSEMYD